ncbi:uncharacterized protein [Tenebrio molitor]|uniref:uncharacterized protein isoform X1 n=1 Tax=Tenebrio molitor TaxID=7067 RepID=UPI003624758A
MPSRSKRILQLAQLAAYTTIHNDTGEEDSMERDFSPDYSNYSDNMSSSFTSSEDEFDDGKKTSTYININTAEPNYFKIAGETDNNLMNNNLFDSETLKQIQENLTPEADNVGKGQDLLWKPENTIIVNNEVAVSSTKISDPIISINISLDEQQISHQNIVKEPLVSKRSFLFETGYKKTFCTFCDSEIDSKHFARHLERNHKEKKEVVALSKLKKNDPERKKLLTLIRNNGNLEAGIRGHIIPKRRIRGQEADEDTYIICSHCKSYIKKIYLCRHEKRCFANTKTDCGRSHAVIDSFIYSACQKKYGKILDSMNLKKEVLSKMRGDNVAKEIMNDILIVSWGDDLLKKTPSNRSKYHLKAKMRRCANFVINMRIIDPKYKDMLSCLKPEAFDDVIEATKKMSRYNAETRTFKSGSTALQFGAYLKQIADLTMKIILRKNILISVGDVEICLRDLKRFKELIESQWTIELGSLAMKDLNNRAANKPKLLPLTEDIMKLKQLLDKCAEEAYGNGRL